MSQRQYKRVEKGESQTQYSSRRRHGRPGPTNSIPKPKYQWFSSAKVRGRGGDSDSAGPPPPRPSNPHSSTNNRFSSAKKSDRQGGRSRGTVTGANSESSAIQNAPLEKSRLSGDPSSPRSLQFGILQGFADEMQADHSSFKRVTAVSTSSISCKQQSQTVLEQYKNEGSHLQPKEDLEQSKNETCHPRPNAKRYIPVDHKSSKPEETDKSSMSGRQLQNQYQEQSKSENPHLQPKRDLELSKNENALGPKGDLEQSMNEAPHLQPKEFKSYIHVQRKLFKPGATVAKWYVENSNTKNSRLKPEEDLEKSKDETLHSRPMVKRYMQVHHNFFKPQVTMSTFISGRQQQKEDLNQPRKEASNLQPKAERDPQNKGVSAAAVVTSTHDVALSVPEVTVSTSSFQQSHIPNCLGIPRPHTWTQGVTSTSFQMSIQLPSGNSSQFPRPPFVPSLQPYPLQAQGVMHYGNSYNFSPQVGHQLESQFANFNGVSSNYMQNHLKKKPTANRSVKITHPETNEELVLENSANRRLAGGSSGPIEHHNMVLQPLPVLCGPSHAMNYFSHVQPNSFSFQSPTSMPFRNSQMLSRASTSGFNSIGMHNVAVATSTGHASLASVLVSNQAATFGEEKNSPLSVGSATTDRKRATKPMDPVRVSYEQGDYDCYSKGFGLLPKSVAASSLTAVPLGTSSATVSVEGVPPGKGASMGINDDGKSIGAIDVLDATLKELQNPRNKYNFLFQRLPQEGTSDFPDNSHIEALEVGESRINTLAPLKEIQQSDTVFGSSLISEPRIPGSSKLEIITLEANHSSVESSEGSSVSSQVCLPGDQAGFPCASIEIPGDRQTGKDLTNGVSSKYIGQNIIMDDAVAVEDAERNNNNDPSEIQMGGKTEELAEKQGTNLFEKPFLHSIYKDRSLNNLRSLEVNQQTMKAACVAEASACDKHAISGFEEDGSHGSIDTWNSVAERTGDALVSYTPSLSHGTDSMVGSPALGSSLECPKVEVEALESTTGPMNVNEISLSESGCETHEVPSLPICSSSFSIQISEVKMSKRANVDCFYISSLRQEDNPISNSNMIEGTGFKGKKKRKEILQKAGAAGASSDLYMAYKDCDEKLRFSDISYSRDKVDNTGSSGRKSYSRVFLLTLAEQFTEFPADFQFAHDMTEGLIISPKASVAHVVDHNSHPSFVQNMDWPLESSSLNHHGRRKDGHHGWTKSPPLVQYETKHHFGINEEASNFYPGREGTYGRNLRGQVTGQYAGGIFTGLLPHPASQGGRIRKGADVDQCQRATAFQKSLTSSPESPLQAMHKAEKKYEVHKMLDAEEAKQRRLKAILNKLTPQNFDRLFQQVKEVDIDSAVTLAGLISQIFDKALVEPTFSEVYANFCYHLASELPDFVEGCEKITFKRLLLNKCQKEFERGEIEQAEADRTDKDGEARLCVEESEEKRIHARRRMLGNIRLIGELYKKKMLTERIMHECIEKLLRKDQFPEEEDIEALCKLMCTIGEIIDHPKAKEHMDAYFEVILNLSNNRELSSRMRFMLKDVIDLRNNKWQQRRKVEGPKKIEELHSHAAQGQQAVRSQLIHAPSIIFSNKRVSTDFGSRSSTFRSPRKSDRAAFHAVSSQNHGFASQDVRLEDRKLSQHRTLSVPFPRRLTDDNLATLRIRGGLTEGMSVRDPKFFCSSPLTELHAGFAESSKVSADPNGNNSIPEWGPYNLKQQLTAKYAPNIFMQAPAYDQSNRQEQYVNREATRADGSFARSVATRTIDYPSRPTLLPKVSSGKRW